MGITIQEFTTKNPIQMIGCEAGVCYGSNTSDPEKNYKRGIDCIKTGHGRTWEFPDVYMIIDGYSARVIREWYTHIGGAPTRLQASTRYINYEQGFDYFTPPSIKNNPSALAIYDNMMKATTQSLQALEALGIPKEDSANGLPLSMETKIVCKHNSRNLIDMSHQRECARAYHEYRKLFNELETALRNYSDEWATFIDMTFAPKCDLVGSCSERKSCGRHPKKED